MLVKPIDYSSMGRWTFLRERGKRKNEKERQKNKSFSIIKPYNINYGKSLLVYRHTPKERWAQPHEFQLNLVHDRTHIRVSATWITAGA